VVLKIKCFFHPEPEQIYADRAVAKLKPILSVKTILYTSKEKKILNFFKILIS